MILVTVYFKMKFNKTATSELSNAIGHICASQFSNSSHG